jgi:hypothetical protein
MSILKPAVVMGLSIIATSLSAQTIASGSNVQSRTQVIAASFSKFKDVTKTKRGITKSKYRRVVSEPAVRANPAEYSGTYEVTDFDFALQLKVDSRGVVTGTGYEPLTEGVRRSFTLTNGKIDGALLTATRVYANGGTERLEGAFMNRTSFDSPTDKGTRVFGLGTLGRSFELAGMTIDKFFYEKTR